MSWKEASQNNIKAYEGLFSEHGINFKSLDWGSRESQILRFKILSEIGVQSGDAILDVGCGLGDLYQWFVDCGKDIDYTGVDITPAFIEAARRRFQTVAFVEANLTKSLNLDSCYDYVVASGIFAKSSLGGFSYFDKMIKEMYKLCRKGVAFNTLSKLSNSLDDGDFALGLEEVMEVCRGFTPWVTIRHDYHPNDMTVYMYREQQK